MLKPVLLLIHSDKLSRQLQARTSVVYLLENWNQRMLTVSIYQGGRSLPIPERPKKQPITADFKHFQNSSWITVLVISIFWSNSFTSFPSAAPNSRFSRHSMPQASLLWCEIGCCCPCPTSHRGRQWPWPCGASHVSLSLLPPPSGSQPCILTRPVSYCWQYTAAFRAPPLFACLLCWLSSSAACHKNTTRLGFFTPTVQF